MKRKELKRSRSYMHDDVLLKINCALDYKSQKIHKLNSSGGAVRFGVEKCCLRVIFIVLQQGEIVINLHCLLNRSCCSSRWSYVRTANNCVWKYFFAIRWRRVREEVEKCFYGQFRTYNDCRIYLRIFGFCRKILSAEKFIFMISGQHKGRRTT